MSVPLRRLVVRTPVTIGALAVLFACSTGRTPTASNPNDVHVDLHTQVSGGSSTLHVNVAYLAQAATAAHASRIQLLDQHTAVATGSQDVPLTIDLTNCLSDPNHVQSGGSSCELIAAVTLQQNGTAVDTVTLGPITVTPGQTVTDSTSVAPIDHIDVDPTNDTIAIGAVVPLLDTVFSTNGVLGNVSMTWQSADTSIAAIDPQSGNVTGVKAGTTTITASAGGKQAQATITVLAASPPGINVANYAAFTATQNGALPAPIYLRVTSKDTTKPVGHLVATITPSGASAWFFANVSDTNYGAIRVVTRPRIAGLDAHIRRQTSGSGVTTPAYLNLHPTSTALTPGVYGISVTITGDGGASAYLAINYTVNAPSANIAFSPSPLVFTQYAYGNTIAGSQTATASVQGGGTLGTLSQNGAITYSGADKNWLSSVSINGATVTVAPSTTALSLGPDTALIPFSASGGSGTSGTLTVIVNTRVTYTKLALGAQSGCGLTTAQTVYCWGTNFRGGLGTGNAETVQPTSYVPVRVLLPTSPSNGVIDIAAGAYHTCAIMQSYAVYCWGNNADGELGLGTADFNDHPTPTQIPGKTYSQIAAGLDQTCGVEGTGGANYLDCWGANRHGELGLGTTDANAHPTPTSTGSMYLPGYVSAGGLHTCALTAAGALYCWGANDDGEIGVGVTGGAYPTPQLVTVNGNGLATTLVSAGSQHTCAIDAQAHAYCWGNNQDGQIGDGTTTNSDLPVEVPNLQFTSVSAGFSQTCGLALGGVPYCWGRDQLGALGNGTVGGNFSSPQAVIINGAATQLMSSSNDEFGCYLASTSGGAYCFGDGAASQLGVDPTSLASGVSATPVPISGQPAPSGVGPSRVVPRHSVQSQRVVTRH